jgi:hypothetical protein
VGYFVEGEDDGDEDEVIQRPSYIPRGTRSRPAKLVRPS